jgi:tetratricopeptide (TPR) repeat protein
MKRIAFLGNCQIDTLYLAYRDYVLPYCDDQAQYIEVYKEIKEEDKEFLLNSDVVVGQTLDTRQKTNLDDFDLKAKIHYVPYVQAGGIYWPYAGFPHPKSNQCEFYPRFEPYNGEAGDFYLNKLLEKNIPPDECVTRYLNEDINKAVNLDRRLAMALGMIENRDKSCGYGVAPFIRDNFRKELLFSSPGHFRRSLSLLLINELFGRLDVEPRLIARLNRLYPGNPHGGNDTAPIHPQVAEHFGLGFIAENQRFRYWFEGRFTFAEFCDRYVRFAFNESLVKAILLAIDGKHDEAIPHFEQALRISPRSGYGHLSFSHSLGAVGRHAEAQAKAEEAAAILADDPEELPNALEHLGHCLIGNGDPAGAEENFRRALTLAPNRPALYRALSSALDRQGRGEEASAIIGDLCALDPLDYEAHAHFGHILAGRGEIDASEQAFRRSLAINPRQAGTLGALSHVLGGLGRREEAITAARDSLAIAPDDIGVLVHLGAMLAQGGDDAAAIDAHRRALTIAADDPRASPPREEIERRLADALARQERLKDAAMAEGEALRQEGLTLFHAGNFVEAEKAFRAALARDDRDPDWHWWLSAALDRQGRTGEAAEAAAQATRHAPDQARYWEHLGHMRAAAGEAEAAARAFHRACEIEPDRASARGALSHILFALGRPQDAIAAARSALVLQPENADLYWHLGNLLMSVELPAEAAEAYRQAIALGRSGEDIENLLATALRRLEEMTETQPSREPEPEPALAAFDAGPPAPPPFVVVETATDIVPIKTQDVPRSGDGARSGFWRRIFGLGGLLSQ